MVFKLFFFNFQIWKQKICSKFSAVLELTVFWWLRLNLASLKDQYWVIPRWFLSWNRPVLLTACLNFAGKVEMDQGQICFNFESLAAVNLFIFKLTGMALGTLKKAATQAKQPSQLQGGGLCKFIMKLSHPIPLNSRNSLRQSFIIIYSESFHTYCFKVNDNT